MDAIVRGVVVYLLLLVIFRIAGKRSLASGQFLRSQWRNSA